MNQYKIKVLSLNKIHWIYCNYVSFSTDGIAFKKEGDPKVYYLRGSFNIVLQAYQRMNDKWIKYYDFDTSYGMITKKEE